MESRRYVAWIHRGNLHGVWGAIVMVIWTGLATALGFPGLGGKLWLIPIAALIGFAMGKAIGYTLLTASGATAQQVYAPAAKGTYAQTFSQIETLEARGHFAKAADAWEAVAVSQPGNAFPLIRAGELYLRKLNEPSKALDRFRMARETPGVRAEHHRYASLKIIDLHLGPLADEGRGLVELRRLIEQHPDSREAESAREALARLKRPSESGDTGAP